jgi:DNA-directed RNA polymerase subunit RPC12/RpoP
VSLSVICQGCGQRLQVADDFKRKKIQCPQCGVMCELPERETTAEASAPRRTAEPASFPARPAAPARRPVPAARTAAPAPLPPSLSEQELFRAKGILTCGYCGAQLKVSRKQLGLKIKCAACGSALAVPAPPKPPADEHIQAAPPPPRVVKPAEPEVTGTHADDGNPYPITGARDQKCPECGKFLPPEAVLCVRCGFNLQTREKAVKVYDEVEREWETGWPYRRRLRVFIVAQCLVVGLGIVAAVWAANLTGFLCAWLPFAGLSAFLLGTYDRINLARNKRGRVLLTKTWHVCFIERPTTTYRLSEYEGLATGHGREVDVWDWFILFILLGSGVVPGVAWWFFVLHADSYWVALTRHHGFPETMLYRGWSEARMREIAKTIRDATGLPSEGT